MELQEITMEMKIEADIHMLYKNRFIFTWADSRGRGSDGNNSDSKG
jgi:hypothetical protein